MMPASLTTCKSCVPTLRSTAGMSPYRKLILPAFILMFAVGSCKQQKKNQIAVSQDTTIIKLPKAEPLDAEEHARLNYACGLWYDSVLAPSGFNGGILVAKKGQIVFERYKGKLHLGAGDSITANTPLHIASVTKTFTAMAVMKLAEEGKLNINDTLDKFFPGFNYPGVTVKSLMNHRSGLPNYLYFMEDLGWNKDQYIGNQDVLQYLINRKSEIKHIGPADKNFNYCNTNYVLLALVIEKVTGKSFPAFMKVAFFDPLQMKNTYVFTLDDSNRIPPSYDWRGREIPINFLDKAYGDKNMYTTPRDLLIWDRALTENILFKSSTLEQAFTPYSNERPGIKNYGLGWRMNVYPTGKKVIFHTGWWHGSNAIFIRLLEEDATIIAVGNRYTNAVYKARFLVNIFSHYFDHSSDDEAESTSRDTLSTPRS